MDYISGRLETDSDTELVVYLPVLTLRAGESSWGGEGKDEHSATKGGVLRKPESTPPGPAIPTTSVYGAVGRAVRRDVCN